MLPSLLGGREWREVDEFDGEGEGGDDGNRGRAAGYHGFDGGPGIGGRGNGDVDGVVGETELVENCEGSASVADGFEGGGHGWRGSGRGT